MSSGERYKCEGQRIFIIIEAKRLNKITKRRNVQKRGPEYGALGLPAEEVRAEKRKQQRRLR